MGCSTCSKSKEVGEMAIINETNNKSEYFEKSDVMKEIKKEISTQDNSGRNNENGGNFNINNNNDKNIHINNINQKNNKIINKKDDNIFSKNNNTIINKNNENINSNVNNNKKNKKSNINNIDQIKSKKELNANAINNKNTFNKKNNNNITNNINNIKKSDTNIKNIKNNEMKIKKELKNKDNNSKDDEKITKLKNKNIIRQNQVSLIISSKGENKEDKERNKKLINDFLDKEKNYKLKIKELENIILNYKEPILVGLNNIGATCYMNATLQCLSNTKKLTQYFLKDFKNDNPYKIMTSEYHKVILNLWKRENNEKSYSPNSFKEVLSRENPLFAGIAANDSKDLINFLIERFHQELNIIINNPNKIDLGILDQTNEQMMLNGFIEEFKENFNSPISNLFYGMIETKSQCSGCKIMKFNFQVYSFLEFPLQQVNQFYFNNGKRPLFTSDGKNPDVDLYECFEYNRKIDFMTGDNQMYCNQCNKLCDASYTTIIHSCPNYLIINLNRGKGAVYECRVIFPEQLNIKEFATFKLGITVYELYAVICHLGPSSMSGHFVAYCKNSIDNKWYLYNDAIVTLCSRAQQYNDGMPYILFYKAAISGT